MKLFVGLGNPGAEHAFNRHNVGFMAVDAIAAAHGFPAWRKRFAGRSLPKASSATSRCCCSSRRPS